MLHFPRCLPFMAQIRMQTFLSVAQEASTHPSPMFAGARRIYMQRGPKGYGFLFSSSTSIAGNGISHYVTKVDNDSPAFHAGLLVTDRILKINNVSVVNVGHRHVVRLMQEVPHDAPIALVVCASPLLTLETTRLNGGVDGTSLSSDAPSLRSANGHTYSRNDNQRMVLVVVNDTRTSTWLAVHLSNVSLFQIKII